MSDNFVKQIATKLKEARYKKNISQRELARLTGVNEQTIALIEKEDEEYSPTVRTVGKLAKALGLKLVLVGDSDLKLIEDSDNPEKDLIAKLREIRKKKKITQTELSRLSGVVQEVISRMERTDQHSPTLRTVSKLVKALGLELDLVESEKVMEDIIKKLIEAIESYEDTLSEEDKERMNEIIFLKDKLKQNYVTDKSIILSGGWYR